MKESFFVHCFKKDSCKVIVFLALIFFAGTVEVAFAGRTSVRNEVDVTVDTGGNRGARDREERGRAQADVSVKTTIDGTVIQNVNETLSSPYADDTVKKEYIHETESGSVSTSVEISTQPAVGENRVHERTNIAGERLAQEPKFSILKLLTKVFKYVATFFTV